MQHVPLVALAVGDRRMKKSSLLPVPRVASRGWRFLSCLFLEYGGHEGSLLSC